MNKNEQIKTEIPVNKINTGYAIRTKLNETCFNELIESVRDKGVIQPLIVRRSKKKKDSYDLIAGLRRLKSAIENHLKTVPCIIRENINDRELLELMLTENLKREDLNPFDEGLAYVRLMKEFSMAVTTISKKLGIPTNRIEDKIKLLDLCLEVQKFVFDGKLDLKTAYALANRPENEQIELANLAIEHELSTEALLNYVHHKKSVGRKNKNLDNYTRSSSPLKINARLMGYVKFLGSVYNNINDIPEKDAEEILKTIDEIASVCGKIKKRLK